MNGILEILAQFGGGRGDPGNNVVRFLLPSVFWAVLAYTALGQWRRDKEAKDLYVGIAALAGLGRELLQLVVSTGSWLEFLPGDFLHYFSPPLEHGILILAETVAAYAFLRYFSNWRRFSRVYLLAGAGAAAVIYVLSAVSWPSFLAEHPEATFGQHWSDMAFRIVGAVSMGTALSIFLVVGRRGTPVPKALYPAFLFFFLDEGLMIVNLAQGEVLKDIFAPIRHNLHIWAIPMLLAVYWTETITRLVTAERVRNAVFNLSPSMLCVADFSGMIKIASPASGEILGYSPEEVRGRSMSEFGCNYQWEPSPSSDQENYQGKSAACYEGPYSARDGSETSPSTNKLRKLCEGPTPNWRYGSRSVPQSSRRPTKSYEGKSLSAKGRNNSGKSMFR